MRATKRLLGLSVCLLLILEAAGCGGGSSNSSTTKSYHTAVNTVLQFMDPDYTKEIGYSASGVTNSVVPSSGGHLLVTSFFSLVPPDQTPQALHQPETGGTWRLPAVKVVDQYGNSLTHGYEIMDGHNSTPFVSEFRLTIPVNTSKNRLYYTVYVIGGSQDLSTDNPSIGGTFEQDPAP